MGSNRVSLRGILKEGRVNGRCLSAESWKAEEILFGRIGLIEVEGFCKVPNTSPLVDVAS